MEAAWSYPGWQGDLGSNFLPMMAASEMQCGPAMHNVWGIIALPVGTAPPQGAIPFWMTESTESSLADSSCMDPSAALPDSGIPDVLTVRNTFIDIDEERPTLRRIVTCPGCLVSQDANLSDISTSDGGSTCSDSEDNSETYEEPVFMPRRAPMSMRAKYGI